MTITDGDEVHAEMSSTTTASCIASLRRVTQQMGVARRLLRASWIRTGGLSPATRWRGPLRS